MLFGGYFARVVDVWLAEYCDFLVPPSSYGNVNGVEDNTRFSPCSPVSFVMSFSSAETSSTHIWQSLYHPNEMSDRGDAFAVLVENEEVLITILGKLRV